MKEQQQLNKTKTKMRPAFMTLDMSFAIAIALILLIGVMVVYKFVYLPSQANGEYSKVAGVISGIDRTKAMNGNVYMAQTNQKISASAMKKLQNSLGGASNSKDVAGWTYNCASGTSSTLTVTTTPYDSATVRDLVIDMVISNNAPWTAAASGTNALVFSKSNVTCQ